MIETNSRYIKVSGKAEIPEDLVLGDGYKVCLDGEITSVSEHNNQNGSLDRSFLFKPALATIEDKYGAVVRAKDIRSWSAKVRRIAYMIWESENDESIDHEAHYERLMKHIVSKIYDLAEEAKHQ